MTPPACFQDTYRHPKLITADIRLRPPSSLTRCSPSHTNQAIVPRNRGAHSSCTIADPRPIVAIVPLSKYLNRAVGSPAASRRMLRRRAAHLDRGLGQLGTGRRRQRDVAGREDPVLATDPQVRLGNQQAAGPLQAQRPGHGRGLHTGRPDRDVARQLGAAGQRDPPRRSLRLIPVPGLTSTPRCFSWRRPTCAVPVERGDNSACSTRWSCTLAGSTSGKAAAQGHVAQLGQGCRPSPRGLPCRPRS